MSDNSLVVFLGTAVFIYLVHASTPLVGPLGLVYAYKIREIMKVDGHV